MCRSGLAQPGHQDTRLEPLSLTDLEGKKSPFLMSVEVGLLYQRDTDQVAVQVENCVLFIRWAMRDQN